MVEIKIGYWFQCAGGENFINILVKWNLGISFGMTDVGFYKYIEKMEPGY